MNQLEKISAARQELAEAQEIPEVKFIHGKAEAITYFVKKQKMTREVQDYANEFLIDCEIKLGMQLKEMPKATPSGNNQFKKDRSNGTTHPTLKDFGITKDQSSNFQLLADNRETVETVINDLKTNGKPIERYKIITEIRRANRPVYEQPEPPEGEYDLIYCDPPWRYEFSETTSRDIENQYPTMTLDQLKELQVPAAKDCVLFMWATAPKLEEAMQVINAWGFNYRSCAVWDKGRIGMGYWFRGQHELLLVAVKGNIRRPEPETRVSSVYNESRSKHSKKPDFFYSLLETMFPNAKRIELFARQEREGWKTWGNE